MQSIIRSATRVILQFTGFILLASLPGRPALADVFYTYTGANYDEFSPSSIPASLQAEFPSSPSPYTPQEHLSLTFEVAAPLSPSSEFAFNGSAFNPNPLLIGYQSFDGLYSASNSERYDTFLLGSVSTDTSGNISSWLFIFGLEDDGIELTYTSCNAGCSNVFDLNPPLDFIQVNVGTQPEAVAWSTSAGTWTPGSSESPVYPPLYPPLVYTPEPSFYVPLVVGVLSLWSPPTVLSFLRYVATGLREKCT